MIFEMDKKEYTYVPDSIEVERHTEDSISLKITSRGQRAQAVIPLSKQECKSLIAELTQSL
jgi:hypothetical protein